MDHPSAAAASLTTSTTSAAAATTESAFVFVVCLDKEFFLRKNVFKGILLI
jgi:hypothetical protein